MKLPPGQARWLTAGAAIIVLAISLILWKSRPTAEITGHPEAEIAAPAGGPPRRDAERAKTSSQPRLADLPGLPAPERPPHPAGSAENQAWTQSRIDSLDALARETDLASLHHILAELRSPLPEIRAAALGATRDFDDPAAIPYLRAISRDTVDPLEVQAIGELIETLTLPALIDSID